MAKKTVGTATLSSSGGSIIGVAVATILAGLLPVDQSPEMFGAIAVVCSAAFAVLGGYLSPVQAGAVAPYLEQTSEEDASDVATEASGRAALSDQSGAEAGQVQSDPVSTDRGSYAAKHATPGAAPSSVEPGLQTSQGQGAGGYPDLDALAKL